MLRVGYGMKIAWRGRQALISIGRMWDSFEIDGGMRDVKSKLVTFCKSNKAGSR